MLTQEEYMDVLKLQQHDVSPLRHERTLSPANPCWSTRLLLSLLRDAFREERGKVLRC